MEHTTQDSSADAKTVHVLLVDADAGEVARITSLLQDAENPRFTVEQSPTLADALVRLAQNQIDIILLDLSLPDSQGLATLQALSATGTHVPIVVLTGVDDEGMAVEALRRGAQDYLVNGKIDGDLLRRSIRYAVERAASDAKLHETMMELQQATKMEAIGRLASGVAHDFNNALTTISGYSSLLQQSLPEHDPRRIEIDEIMKAVDHATSLTRKLLEFSRRRAANAALVNLVDVVRDMRNMLRPIIGEDVELVTTSDADIPCVMADRAAMEQIIMNLAVNARDAMPHGGTLLIEAVRRDVDHHLLAGHTALAPGTYVELAVTDTGTGIAAKDLPHIFEPFYTTKSHGTGLGLSTVYGLVKQNSGHISLYTELDIGTCFRIYLPAAQGQASAAPRAGRDLGALSGSETILLIEDDPALRLMVRRFLERMRYTLLIASSGELAIERSRGYEGDIHLVLCDVVLPDMDGPQVVAELCVRRPGLKALFMSAYSGETVVRRGLLLPEMPFISKPFTIDEIGVKIRDVLRA